jgi:AraC-like DNA-binding protein
MDWITGISKAIDYIEEHITEPTDYARAAKEACSSPFNFQRVFALLCGYTLGDYVRMRRLTLAGEELLSTELVWAPVLFILRKGGKNVILIEESILKGKRYEKIFEIFCPSLSSFARAFAVHLAARGLCNL